MVWHEGIFRCLLFCNLILRNRKLLACYVSKNNDLSFFATEQAAQHFAVLHCDGVISECLRYVAVRVKDFFCKSARAPLAHTIQLRTNSATFPANRMTRSTILTEYHLSGINGNIPGSVKGDHPCIDKSLPFFAHWLQPGSNCFVFLLLSWRNVKHDPFLNFGLDECTRKQFSVLYFAENDILPF